MSPENLVVLFDLLLPPIGDRRIAPDFDERIGEDVFDHRIIRPICFKIIHPPELRLDIPVGHILLRRANDIADQRAADFLEEQRFHRNIHH